MIDSFRYLLCLCLCLFTSSLADDPNRLPTKCEVCKLLAQELTENLQAHNSPMVIETSYSLDSKQAKKTKYTDSYVAQSIRRIFHHYSLVEKHD